MLKHLNLKKPVVIDIDPASAEEGKDDYYAIWTDEKGAINATLAESIGEEKVAKIICDAINKELNF